MQGFFWYELMTEAKKEATAFYQTVVGWDTEPFGDPSDPYIIVKAGAAPVGGIMNIPPEAKAMGATSAWMGYIYAPDVDAAVTSLKAAGGTVMREPTDIPTVGRFAVVADPQGAVFMLMTPMGEASPEKPAPDTPGLVGWRELMAGDLDTVWDFYAAQFGWTKAEAVPMGDLGIYQLFNATEDQQGGMMTKPPMVPRPYWGFYFNVADIDAAFEKVTANGGQVVMGPMEVPGGQWVLNAMDPQGAFFGLVAPSRG